MNSSSATKTKSSISKEQFEKAEAFLLQQLQTKLPPYLTYHNAAHTKNMIKATDYLLQREGVPEEDRWLLLTAAFFHDAGFLRIYDNHEEFSCDVAWETLPAFGYSNESIEAICRLIRVTKLPQAPVNHYEKIICDADLHYLGTVEFSITAQQLYKEWRAAGHVQSEEEWTAKQIHFLQEHRYFTNTAKSEMEPKKQAHIQSIQKIVQRKKRKRRLSSGNTDYVKEFLWMALGVLVSGFALKSFLVPHLFLMAM